jgi:hypothetical protein
MVRMSLVFSPCGRRLIGVSSSIASPNVSGAATTAAAPMAAVPAMPVTEHVHGNEQDE